MKQLISRGVIVVGVLGASAALAGPKPLAGTDHDPPRFVDESSDSILLLNQGKDGYRFKASVTVSGEMSKGSIARLDWMQGGKVVATVPCKREYSQYEHSFALSCWYQGKPVQAKGPVDAEVILTDDTDSKEYLLRDFKVVPTPFSGDQYGPVWQIVPDDLLASAYAVHLKTQHEDNGKVEFRFWTTTNDGNGVKAQLRCTVDGKKLDDDVDSTFEDVRGPDEGGGHGETIAEVVPAHGDRKVYRWKHIAARGDHLYYGKADDSKKHANAVFLGDHPGAWVCDLRKDHNNIRQFLFTVNADGMIDSAAMQQGAGAVPVFPDVALVDVRIPKDSKWDARVRPAAMKKSRGWGLAWPKDPSVKTIQATYPAASGLPDPH